MLNIDKFISTSVTGRMESHFQKDFQNNKDNLKRNVEGNSVLVIGGGGTIGSSFIKEMLHFRPNRLIVIDQSENYLAELTRDLRSSNEIELPTFYRTYPIDFNNHIIDRIFSDFGPFDIVANFAAHKHVRSEKDQYSIIALLENNIINAQKLLDKLLHYKPSHFFCVSTDKAANPVNIMGASKKLMEDIIMAYSLHFNVTTARFANVAFSNGSLLAGYVDRIMKRQPLSCPSDISRFFVSPKESGQICLMACLLGNSGDIFFPKLFEENLINLKEITLSYLNLLGFEPQICKTEDEARKASMDIHPKSKFYPVHFFSSDTSGEKYYEEFYTSNENVDLKSYRSLGVIKKHASNNIDDMRNITNELIEIISNPNLTKSNIVEFLESKIPTFRHKETGKNLDQKM